MHELWLCQSILEIIKQQANTTQCARIKKIVLEMGQLVAVEKNALIFGFRVIAKGTVAEDAEVSILDIPGEALCESCEKQNPLQNYFDACPACGSHALKVIHGEELRIKSMVIE
ncbi:hydrogenase maturation nickel metallochaperone HypA [Legionella sp. PC997]|uniref:hydrogenase maturation nickel metallochaperone HypA n=1 Tax=Legionella sp. PC997 TaxID=2755562 RepID=UPI0015FAC31F|nr:hydrogenase maturation nickel metallochaperone HypA [Legionella sp. PC997]QMT60922.1 Hydrogenase maturation factor HybF [Legionella sp. PC997]